ncbi:TlpA disulfide reductase family protein, partial [Fibrobacterota bacterium]
GNEIIIAVTGDALEPNTSFIPDAGLLYLRRKYGDNKYGFYRGILKEKGYKKLNAFKIDGTTFKQRASLRYYDKEKIPVHKDIWDIYLDDSLIYVPKRSKIFYVIGGKKIKADTIIEKPLITFVKSELYKSQIPSQALVRVGDFAPIFMLRSLEGDWVSLRDFCGVLRNNWMNKVKYNVILNFWATYCVPCKKEIPELEAFAEKYSTSTKLLLVSIDKIDKKKVKNCVKERNYKSPVLLDMYQKISQNYGVFSVPALFLIDSTGVVRYKAHQYEENGIQNIEKAIESLSN